MYDIAFLQNGKFIIKNLDNLSFFLTACHDNSKKISQCTHCSSDSHGTPHLTLDQDPLDKIFTLLRSLSVSPGRELRASLHLSEKLPMVTVLKWKTAKHLKWTIESGYIE